MHKIEPSAGQPIATYSRSRGRDRHLVVKSRHFLQCIQTRNGASVCDAVTKKLAKDHQLLSREHVLR